MTWLLNIIVGLLSRSWPRRPPTKYDIYSLRKIIWVIENKGVENPNIEFSYEDINEGLLNKNLLPMCDYVNHRYDCSDFRILQIIKLKLIGQEILNKYPKVDKTIKETLLNFKFWLLSPGYDSMCYYSENHQLCFIACEYLIGKLYPNDLFKIDNKNGLEHQKIALERFNDWIELRNKYSYSEFYSSNYMPISLTALAVLYQYSDNEEIKNKCKKQMDIILKFFATTAFEYTWINASGRDYSRNVMNCSYNEPHAKTVISAVFDSNHDFAFYNYASTESMFCYLYLKEKTYQLDKSILDLYNKEETITKRRFSLNLSDYEKEGLLNNDTKSLMMRLGSGALTNPEIIDLTIKLLKDNRNLFKNNFLCWLRFYYSPILYKLGLMPKMSKKKNFFNNRMSIEESNVYTYRTKFYKMSTNQNYQMNSLGAQKNTSVVTLPKGITVFTMHPIVENNLPNYNYNNTPSYFACYNFAPCAIQDKNVCLIQYNIPSKNKVFLYNNKLRKEKILKYTHTFFPTELFDEYSVEGRYAFVRVDGSYLALIGLNDLYLKKNSEYVMKTTQGMLKDINKSFDLVQEGLKTYWIYELSDKTKESFEEFKNRIKSNKIIYNDTKLEYFSTRNYKVVNYKEFYIDNEQISLKYKYDTGD